MSTEVTDLEIKRKLLQCLDALRAVKDDLGFMSLDEATRELVEEARSPISGCEVGFARLDKESEGPRK